MKFNIKQINSLCQGTRHAIKLENNSNLIKVLFIEGYTYNSYNERVKPNKFVTNDKVYDIYFEIKTYEYSVDLNINDWDITQYDLNEKIINYNIKGIENLELILNNYIKNYCDIKPEWCFEDIPFI